MIRSPLCLLVLFLAPFMIALGQEIDIHTLDVSNAPTIETNLRVYGADGRPVRGLTAADVQVTENGTPRPVTVMMCPMPDTVASSIGIMVDTKNHIDLARACAVRVAERLPMPPCEVGITSMQSGVQIDLDFTMNRSAARRVAAEIPPAPGVNLNAMYNDPVAGGIPFVSGRANPSKALVLVSDLHCPIVNIDEAALIATCQARGIRLYAILLHTGDYYGLFTRLAAATGGTVYPQVTSADQIRDIADRIVRRVYEIPCGLQWTTEPSCDNVQNVRIAVPSVGIHVDTSYRRPLSTLITVDVVPSYVIMGDVAPGSTATRTVTITAGAVPLIVTSITPSDANFSVQPQSFTIPANGSRQLTVAYTAPDRLIRRCVFTIEGPACARTFTAAAGSVIDPNLEPLRVVFPNGDEELLAGADTVLRWDGVPADQPVALDYSIDGGSSWIPLAPAATGLAWSWKPVPLPPSQRCLLRATVRTPVADTILPQEPFERIGATKGLGYSNDGLRVTIASSSGFVIMDATSLVVIDSTTEAERLKNNPSVGNLFEIVSWSPDDQYILTRHGDSIFRVWDAATATVRFELTPHASHARHAVWHPSGRYIASVSSTELYVHDIADGSLVYRVDNGYYIAKVAWSDDGRYVVFDCQDSGATIVDHPSGTVLYRQPPSPPGIAFSALSHSGSLLAMVVPSAGVDVWNWQSATRVRSFPITNVDIQMRGITWSPDDTRIAVWNSNGATIVDASTGTVVIHKPQTYGYIESVQFHPITGQVAIYSSYYLDLYDGRTGEHLVVLDLRVNGRDGGGTQVEHMAWSPDGRHMITGGQSGSLVRWTLPDFRTMQVDTSDALWSIVAPEIDLRVIDVDMGTVTVGDDTDSTVTAVLCNTGTAPLHVLGVDITSGDRTEFQIPVGAGDFFLEPGACRSMEFEFLPAQEGARRAYATVRTTIGDLADTIAIHGLGVLPRLGVASYDVDMGTLVVGDVRDSTVADAIRSLVGTVLVDSVRIVAGMTDQFTLTDAPVDLLLSPSASTTPLGIRFHPTTVGRKTSLVRIHARNISPALTIRLLGMATADGALSIRSSLDIAAASCAVSVDTSMLVRNETQADVTIASVDIQGPSASAVTVGLRAGDVIPALSDSVVPIVVSSTLPGQVDAVIGITTTDGDTYRTSVTVLRDSTAVAYSRPILAMVTSDIAIPATDSVTFTHAGSAPYPWVIGTVYGPFTLTGATPNPTPARGSSTLTFSYQGTVAGAQDAATVGAVDDCGRTAELMLTGTVLLDTPTRDTLRVGTAQAYPGESVTIPIRAIAGAPDLAGRLRNMTLRLCFNATLLVPDARGGKVQAGIHCVDVPWSDASATTMSLPMYAALGDDTATAVWIDSVWSGTGPVTAVIVPGSFTLAGVCLDNGLRLFSPISRGSLRAKVVTGGRLEVVSDAADPLPLNVDLYASDGALLWRTSSAQPARSTSSFSLPTVPGGLYFLRVTTPYHQVVVPAFLRP